MDLNTITVWCITKTHLPERSFKVFSGGAAIVLFLLT